MLLSHWYQLTQVSGAFGTLEASLEKRMGGLGINGPITPPYSLVAGLNLQPLNTWLLTPPDSCRKMVLSLFRGGVAVSRAVFNSLGAPFFIFRHHQTDASVVVIFTVCHSAQHRAVTVALIVKYN